VLIDHRLGRDARVAHTAAPALPASREPDLWRRIGEGLLRNQHLIRRVQWAVIAVYLALLIVPVALPLPERTAHLWNNVTLLAQFVFWGLWWPCVLLSMMVVGRAWCGLLCPEGALSEFASSRSRGRAIPRWITWDGWPFVAFVSMTVYGQMVSVYQYPRPALVILGGSTMAAIAVGAMFARGKRVWCRFLCPVSGVFGLLAKLAPLHFKVDGAAWRAAQAAPKQPLRPVNCAPLVPIRTMRGAKACHMCGRCSGFRGAITLARRSPNDEIVTVAGDAPNAWETALLVCGMIGVASGAFHWAASPWYVAAKQAAAGWLVRHDILWPLEGLAPWWLLTNYPDRNDVLTLLDGAVLIAYVLATAAVLSAVIFVSLGLATRALGPWSWPRLHHLAQSLIPVAGCGLFLGLSALSVSMLRADGISLPWIDAARADLIAGASLWSLWLAGRIAWRYADAGPRVTVACLAMTGAVAAADAGPGLLFWGW